VALGEPEDEGLLDAMACGLVHTTSGGTFLRVNRTFCTWVGYEPEALIGARRLQDLLSMGGKIFHQTHWVPLLQMQGSVSEVKLDVLHKDGSTLPLVLNAVVRKRGDEVVHEVAAFIARDRDRYERELLLSRRKLEQAAIEATRLEALAKDRALLAEEMIGIVSHDLRNPLSSIALGSALLASSALNEGQLRTLARIGRATERANRLIADLLDFTQARIGKGLSVALEPIDVHVAVGHAVDELAHVYPGRALRHVQRGRGESMADANRLAQLIGNLVSNAMVYGKPDAPITVTSSTDDTAFSVAVHNEGPAIPEDVQARMFQPMTRGTNASSASRSIGLGLFIVHEIAKAHRGTAKVSSTAEAGTTFSAVFPRG
jgi:sigma-B regulation protein RsbU (phosphoserine phosphatase)